jgi:DNA-binding MarR family transcriptional regulator
MNEQLRAISELNRVIHEPGRLMIIGLLAVVRECDFLYLLHETGMNKGNLSSHLARLEEARYVEIEKTYRGKVPQTLLRLTPSGRAAFNEYRRGLKAALLTAHASRTRPPDMKKLKSRLARIKKPGLNRLYTGATVG